VFTSEVLIGLRWVHFVAGITWIGLMYWFSLVNVPLLRVLDPAVTAQLTPPLLRRALAWFRWSSLVTVVVGLLLIYGLYWQDGDFFGSNTEKTIFAGGLLGVVMLAIVWGVVAPNQQRVLTAVSAGQAPDPAWPRRALIASRMNFALSFPLLFFMAGSSHFPLDWPGIVVVGIALALLGAFVVLTVQKFAVSRF
jgi:uncharacterized membrane protein